MCGVYRQMPHIQCDVLAQFPDVVLALLAENEQLRRQLEQAQAERDEAYRVRDGAVIVAEQAHEMAKRQGQQ